MAADKSVQPEADPDITNVFILVNMALMADSLVRSVRVLLAQKTTQLISLGKLYA